MGGLFPYNASAAAACAGCCNAFQHGGGVPFEKFGPEGVFGLDVINRGQYEHRLTSYWLKAMPDVQARLEAGGRALDVGCGAGRIAVTLAKAFPGAKVVGLDPDRESIRQAEAGASKAGLSGRVSFVASTTGKFDAGEGFDLITACDCVHDFAAPQPTLKEMRALLKPEGTLFIIEPPAADKLEDNINPIATMLYGFSIFHCMTQSLAQGGPGLGTCMGPARTEKLVREAGFTSSANSRSRARPTYLCSASLVYDPKKRFNLAIAFVHRATAG